MNLQELTIKELIESIDENILETKEARKKLIIGANQKEDLSIKKYKNELIEKYGKDITRYQIQKLKIEEIIKDHALYAYRKTAQEGQVQETIGIFKPSSSDGYIYNCNGILNPFQDYSVDKNINNFSTKDLVEELRRREGVEFKQVDPYQDELIEVNGPSLILIITD